MEVAKPAQKTGEKERRIGTSTQKVEIKINKREIEKLRKHLATVSPEKFDYNSVILTAQKNLVNVHKMHTRVLFYHQPRNSPTVLII